VQNFGAFFINQPVPDAPDFGFAGSGDDAPMT